MASGELCATTTGTFMMLQLCAISWATCEQWKLLDMLPSELEVVHPGMAMCIVQGES